MKRHFAIFVAPMALILAAPAMAERPSFSFIEIGYQSVDLDVGGGFDVDGDGFGLGGSFEIGDDWFGFINYSSIGFDFNVDLTQWQAGAGWHTGMSDNTDFYAALAYVSAEVDAPGFGSADDSGYGVAVGIRSNLSELIQLEGQIAYADFGDGSDSTTIGGNIWFNVADNLALGVGAETDDDITAFGASLRWYFDE